jgi:hypothetical protein
MQWVPGLFLRVLKRPKREADHSPHLVSGLRNALSYTSIPPYEFMSWCLIKQGIGFHGVGLS